MWEAGLAVDEGTEEKNLISKVKVETYDGQIVETLHPSWVRRSARESKMFEEVELEVVWAAAWAGELE